MQYEEFAQFIGVSRETYVRLSRYVDLLIEWNAAINLVSDVADLWHRHILDSAQLADHIEKGGARAIVDMGSGGGLPGIVLAIMNPNPITLIESDRRKSLFLKHCVRELELFHVEVINDRIEKVDLSADYVTARALASLDVLLGLSKNFLTPGTTCLFPKGKNYDKEVEQAKAHWNFDLEKFESVSGDGVLLKIRKINQRDGSHDEGAGDC